MNAPPPIVAIKDGAVSFSINPLFSGVTLGLGRGERACLIGRNGCGKSTLMKCLAGLREFDDGDYFVQPGITISYLPQDETIPEGITVNDFIRQGHKDAPDHMGEKILKSLELDGERTGGTLSGGEARRASLARALAGEPDVLLLDEPTNHLDLPAIEWLEGFLKSYRGALLMVSHDRRFLEKASTSIRWLRRGRVLDLNAPFNKFDQWSEDILLAEEKALNRLDTEIAKETRWLARGVTARRKRNQGRLHRLDDMRRERAARNVGAQRVKLSTTKGLYIGKLVADAEHLCKSFPLANSKNGKKIILDDFSTRILKGDRIGVIGPNGAGKTTLLKILTGEEKADSGRLRMGQNLIPAVFDQKRESLDPRATLWQTLCPAGGDHIQVQGSSRHVVGYLRDFLFDHEQVKSPVGTLSGGETNRLLLARTLAQSSNLLILDEPTNDLDMDTLDLLYDTLSDYDGTLILVSHDRDFLDKLVTSIIAVEGNGDVHEYVGGFDDYLRQKKGDKAQKSATTAKPNDPAAAALAAGVGREKPPATKLTYKDQRELSMLPGRIEKLTREITGLEEKMEDPGFFLRDPKGFEKTAARLEEGRIELEYAEERWLELDAMEAEIAQKKSGSSA